MDTDD
jgi:hypothetical protein